MLFAHAARAVAWTTVVRGTLRAGKGLLVATAFGGHSNAARRYLGNVENTGAAIYHGVTHAVAGIVIGVLAHIGQHISSDRRNPVFEKGET